MKELYFSTVKFLLFIDLKITGIRSYLKIPTQTDQIHCKMLKKVLIENENHEIN